MFKLLAETYLAYKSEKAKQRTGSTPTLFLLIPHPYTPEIAYWAGLMLMPDINFIIQSPIQEQHGFYLKGI